MKTKIMLLTICCLLLAAASAKTTGKIKIGYLVAIDNPGERLNLIKTTDLADVYALSEVQFPNNCIDWGKELQKSVFYQLESRNRSFYVEVKRINRNGKYRRMSNREWSGL
ncbi:MAG TPA: hypothetical protein VLH16_01750 [Bacteroidales bacterium]|nr:hypothetical protein [Bacteroidales bacterium]